ncbi:MAG: CDP-alcohol phosphatidyltransferase family protein, partial [Gemmataceae bacterium]
MERDLAGTRPINSGRAVLFNLPNQLTGLRFLLSFVLFYLISQELWLASLVVFVVAAFTDWLDGYLARTQNMQSSLGRNLDPLVDKVLICGAFIFLIPIGTAQGWLAPWMVTLIVARELLITGLRNFIEQKGVSFGA